MALTWYWVLLLVTGRFLNFFRPHCVHTHFSLRVLQLRIASGCEHHG